MVAGIGFEPMTFRLVPFGGDRFKAIRKELHFLCYRTVDRDSPKTRKFCEWLIAEAILRKL